MNRSSSSVIAALALAGSLACGGSQEGAVPSTESGAGLRTTALSDQFNSYDSSVWQMSNWANGTPFNCGFLPDHVTFSGGYMTLKLDNTASSGKSYSGGEYRTTDTVSYGKFETRMKPASASGIVSSFFTYTGSPWDEIDIEFLGKNTTQVQFNYFVNGTGGHELLVDLGFDASAGYHTYGFDWEPNSISWYVDGVLKRTVTGSPSTLPSHPQQIMMNLWNGIGVDSWLGSFSYSGPLYASYDYVTYTPAGSSPTTYSLAVAKSGSGSGTVTSSAGGINCGSTCSATLNSGTTVTLTATPASGSTFAGWSGDCSGTGACVLSMTANHSVGAAFNGPSNTGGPVSISAGGSASGSFVADTDYSGGSTSSSTATIDTSLLSAAGVAIPPQSVLQHERYGTFTYTIPGLTAGSPYAVTLYFDEIYWTAAGKRLFNVAINGASVLSSFDIYATAGGNNKAIARTFSATANGSGQVVIAFTSGSVDYAKVDGITVAAGSSGTSYTLTVADAGTGSGTVTSSTGGISCGASCSASLASGTAVTLTAAPASGSTFAGWSGACTGTGTCIVTMTAAQSVTATFTASSGTTYALAVTKSGTGSGTVAGGAISCGSTCSATLASGTTVTLTATPASGSTFGGWGGACSGTGSCAVTMNAAQTVTATFTASSSGSCKAISGGQSGNFNTTGAICFTVSSTVNGWGCSNADGRTVTVNGTAVTCGQLPLPGGAPYTFSFTAGSYPWASMYWW